MICLLAGCATVPRDAGFAEIRQQVQSRLGEDVFWLRGGEEDAAVAEQVRALLAVPLEVDVAVRVALLNHRGLQAEYEDLGVAQADLVQAGLLRNPVFGWSRQQGGGVDKVAWGVEVDFLGLLLTAPHRRIESLRFDHARLRVTQAVLRHATETRKAWFEALAAEQSAQFMRLGATLPAAEAELAERQRKAGNLGRRDALRQQAFDTEAGLRLAEAEAAAYAARERLNRLMGLQGEETRWRLPGRLPELPQPLPDYGDVESWGLRQRIDLQLAQKEAEALAAGLGLARDMRFVNVLDLAVETEKSTGEKRITGPALRFEFPVFDQGQARVSRLEAQYRQSEARLYALAVDARSEIRESLQRATTAYRIARQQRDVLVPLRRQIVDESTLHYNGMLIGVYELLADAREQVSAVQGHIAATRDFWMALADLQMAAGGRLPALSPPPSLPPPAENEEGRHRHQEHDQ